MRDPVQQAGQMAAHVGVPGVGVHQIAASSLIGHSEVGGQRAQRGVGTFEKRLVLGVCRGAVAWIAHAVHVDLGQLDQLADEEVDVNAGTSIDVGRIFSGEDADAHDRKGTS